MNISVISWGDPKSANPRYFSSAFNMPFFFNGSAEMGTPGACGASSRCRRSQRMITGGWAWPIGKLHVFLEFTKRYGNVGMNHLFFGGYPVLIHSHMIFRLEWLESLLITLHLVFFLACSTLLLMKVFSHVWNGRWVSIDHHRPSECSAWMRPLLWETNVRVEWLDPYSILY